MNITRLSWKNIVAKPLNTLLSVLLFGLSIGLLVFLVLFNHQLKQGLERNLASVDLVIGAKGSPLQLVLSSMYHIDAPTGNIPISEVAPFLNPQHPLIASSIPLSLGDSYGAYRIVGAPQTILNAYDVREIDGEIYKNDFDAIVGSIVADKLHLHKGDEFQSTHGFLDEPDLAHDHGQPFVVTGILPETGSVLDQLILCTPQTIWRVHEHSDTSAEEGHDDHAHGHAHDHDHGAEAHHDHSKAVVTLDSAMLKTLGDSVNASLRANPEQEITSMLVQFRNKTSIQSLNFLRNINVNTGLMAASPAIELNRLYAMLSSGTESLQYIAFLIAVVAAISIFISLYTSLKERHYEMAMLRVAGAGPGDLFKMVVLEGLWIAFIGLAVGLLLGHAGMELAGDILQKSYRYAFTGMIWVKEEIFIVAGAIIIGLLAALFPALRGSRINLHRTLAEK
jgi:putative ABC transport system permease protein